METRRLGIEHRSQLASFDCAQFRQPWTDAVEFLVKERLADSIESGEAQAIGLWDDDSLCGIAAWTEASRDEWHSSIIAVKLGYVGRGDGGRLKDELIAIARSRGVSAIVSWVHRDNLAMVHINERLGAVIRTDPEDPRREFLLCTLVIR